MKNFFKLLRTLCIFYKIKLKVFCILRSFLANLKQSKKRMRQDRKRCFKNKSNLSRIRTFMKKFLFFIKSSDVKSVSARYSFLVSEIDKSVRRGVFHKNKANRLKSVFSRKVKLILGV